MSYKVFISHSSRDTWVVEQIERHVRDCGAETFLDERDIHVGDDFQKIINNELKQRATKELLLYLTPWAKNRPYILLEIGAALSRNKRISVILHGITPLEFQGDAEIPTPIRILNVKEINQIEEYFKQLRNRIAKQEDKA